MDWIRYLNPDAIPESGLRIGTIGRFTLVLHRDKTFLIIDNLDMFDHLSSADLVSIKDLVDLQNEWSNVHKFSR